MTAKSYDPNIFKRSSDVSGEGFPFPPVWVQINDDDPIPLCEIPQYKKTKYEFLYLLVGHRLDYSDGSSWGCVQAGDNNTAQMVRVRRLGAKE